MAKSTAKSKSSKSSGARSEFSRTSIVKDQKTGAQDRDHKKTSSLAGSVFSSGRRSDGAYFKIDSGQTKRTVIVRSPQVGEGEVKTDTPLPALAAYPIQIRDAATLPPLPAWVPLTLELTPEDPRPHRDYRGLEDTPFDGL